MCVAPAALSLVVVLLFSLGTAAGAEASRGVYVIDNSSKDVSQYEVGAGGALSPETPATVAAGNSPAQAAVSPDGNSVYVANCSDNDISQYDVGAGAALSPKSPATVSAGNCPVAVAVSPDGKSVYVTNVGDKAVEHYDVGTGGTLSAVPGVFTTGNDPEGIAVSPDGNSVYVTNRGGSSVSQFDVGTGGTLSLKTTPTVAAGMIPETIAVSPDGRSVYVVNFGNGTPGTGSISQYDVGSGGLLSPKTPATAATGNDPLGIAVSPDGQSVYVTNQGDDAVAQYGVGAGGALSPKTPAAVPTGAHPWGVAVSPDGNSVYVANAGNADVSQYDAGSGGALSPKTPATVPADTGPEWLAVSPDQAPTAAFSANAAPAGSASSFDGSASSDSDGTVARYDWDFGDGTSAPNAGPTPSHTYSVPGSYTVTLTVTDDIGCSTVQIFTGQTVSCNGGPAARTSAIIVVPAVPPPIAVNPPPTLSHARLTNRRFRVAHRGTAIFAKKAPLGTSFRFTLSAPAKLKITITRSAPGRRSGHRCVAPSRKLERAHAKRCTRILIVGTLTRARERKGADRVYFSGRIGRRPLSPRSYHAILSASNTGGRSKPVTLTFVIVH